MLKYKNEEIMLDKAEYIKQLKKLLTKHHPDFCNDNYFESMYQNIMARLMNELNDVSQIKTKEPDYLFYKLGIKYYKNINPNYFYKRNSDTTFETKTFEELLSVLDNIFLSFRLSEYFFNKISNEYPLSPYSEDAKEKIDLLKKLYKSYENIELEKDKILIINNGKYIAEMGLSLI